MGHPYAGQLIPSPLALVHVLFPRRIIPPNRERFSSRPEIQTPGSPVLDGRLGFPFRFLGRLGLTVTEPGESSSPPRQRRRGESSSSTDEPDVTERRFLQNRYFTVKSQIYDERDDLSMVDSDKFGSIIKEVESLHEQGRIQFGSIIKEVESLHEQGLHFTFTV